MNSMDTPQPLLRPHSQEVLTRVLRHSLEVALYLADELGSTGIREDLDRLLQRAALLQAEAEASSR